MESVCVCIWQEIKGLMSVYGTLYMREYIWHKMEDGATSTLTRHFYLYNYTKYYIILVIWIDVYVNGKAYTKAKRQAVLGGIQICDLLRSRQVLYQLSCQDSSAG